MTVGSTFDRWASDDRDRGMEERHWRTAKHAIDRMPVEAGDVVLDLGCGSGYGVRALGEMAALEAGLGIDAAPEMVRRARSYTRDESIAYLVGSFDDLPLATDGADHAWSMEALYYAADPAAALEEIHRVLGPGGTLYCAVNYFEESVHSHEWDDRVAVPMTRWSEAEYRVAFRDAGFSVASQDRIPDRDIEIPPASAFPLEEWETRSAMVERYRHHGTLLTVGVAH